MPPKTREPAGQEPDGDASAAGGSPGAADVDDAELRQQSLVASTFANVELQSTKATLAQYVNLYNSAREEVGKLTSELQERDRDAMTVVQFLRNDLEARQDQIKELKKKIDDDVAAAKRQAEEEKAALRDEIDARDGEIESLQEKCGRLEADLEALHAFRRERENMHHELARLHDEHNASVEKYEAELSKQRFLSLEEKVRLKAEERTMQDRFDAEVNARAMKLLDAKTKEINAENFMLLKDKAMLEKELQHANAVLGEATAKQAEQQREGELARLADAEHVKRSVTRAREAKELQQRCEEMEANLTMTVREYDAKLATARARHEKEAARLTRERDDAVRTAELIQRDFLKMRKLARTVVQQRTELETFFTESLDYVKNEIARERRQLMPAAQGSGARIAAGANANLPRITAGPNAAVAPLPNLTGSGTMQRGAAARAARRAQHEQELRGSAPRPVGTGTSSVRAAAAAATHGQYGFFAEGNAFEALSGTRSKEPGASSTQPAPTPSALPPIGASSRSGAAVQPPSPQRPTPPPGQHQHSDPEAAAEHHTAAGGEAGMPDGRVDISELSWEDKERVLRILFAKINTVSNQPAKAASRSALDTPAIEDGRGSRSTVFMTQQ